MILEELVLENVGVFADRQAIPLNPPSTAKPVVLIGGLNGAGKTTIRDALFLVLYGPFAFGSRGTRNYDAYLASLTHNGRTERESSIELRMQIQRNGGTQDYVLRRSWKGTSHGIREHFSVSLNRKVDRTLADMWPEHVETILPRGVADLFFFDGEQIEALADLERSRTVLQAGMSALLGLDLIRRLDEDLAVVRRRHRTRAVPTDLQPMIDAARQDLIEVRQVEQAQVDSSAAAGDARERAHKVYEEMLERFRSSGGELLDQSAQVEERISDMRAELGRLDNNLRAAAAGALPFLYISRRIRMVADQASVEAEATREQIVLHELGHRDGAFRSFIAQLDVSAQAAEAMTKFLENDRTNRAERSLGEQITGLHSAAGISFLADQALPELRQSLDALLERRAEVVDSIDESERILDAMPNPDAVAQLRKDRDECWAEVHRAEAALAHAEEQLTDIRKVRQRKERAYEKVLDEAASIGLEAADNHRLVEHIDKVRQTLTALKGTSTERHADRIAGLIHEALTQLLRKERLITEVSIRPDDCRLELFGAGGEPLSADQLSAGERQLLAVAILWGLARASGQPLPILIDTPLGRLDRSHRNHLVARYFPFASHQVILLSTDTEIDESAYASLKKHVGHAYELCFDPAVNASTLSNGYFW